MEFNIFDIRDRVKKKIVCGSGARPAHRYDGRYGFAIDCACGQSAKVDVRDLPSPGADLDGFADFIVEELTRARN